MHPRTLWLVRHGQTAWNAEGRWQGSRDVPLSAVGRAQASSLAARFAVEPLVAAFSSDLSRAAETASLASPGLEVRRQPLLRELSYGDWEGVRDVEVEQRWPDDRRAWRERPHDARPPGGESLDELAARAWRGLVACLDDAPAGDVLVVAHGGVNRVLLARILGAPLARFWAFDQSPSAVNRVEVPPGAPDESLLRARVLLLNCTRHLAPS
jgi:broad specificity phosphatase PhoE